MSVGARVFRRQANVFVEVEGGAKREIQPLLAMHLHEALINAFHGPAGGEAQHQMRISPQFLGDDPRHQLGGGIRIRLNDYFHGIELTTKGRWKPSHKSGGPTGQNIKSHTPRCKHQTPSSKHQRNPKLQIPILPATSLPWSL